jgi:plastocyanin
VIRRTLLAGALLAGLALGPAAASQAATTRAVQAFDTPTFRTIWVPSSLPAQVGDTIEWRFTQPGNPNASTHDVWLIAPNSSQAQQLGASYFGPTARAEVTTPGTYTFYCSIHGGLAPGGMNGIVNVGSVDPGPAVDPGTPWTDPNWEDPDYPGEGPAALVNDTLAPTIFEEGDTTAPTLDLLRVQEDGATAKVRADISEAGTVTLRLKQGRKVVATSITEANAGRVNVAVKLPRRLRDDVRRYRLEVWTTDAAEIDSDVQRVVVRLGR